MKALAGMYSKIMNLPVVTLFYIAVLICVAVPVNGENVLLGLTRSETLGVINYLALSRWLMMMSAPVLVNGWYLERSMKIGLFIQLRMKNRERFRMFLMSGCVLNSIIWSFFLLVAAIKSFGFVVASQQLILMMPNLVMWAVFTATLFLLQKNTPVSGVFCIGLIGGTYLIGERIPAVEKLMPAQWGMLCRHTQSGWSITYMVFMSVLLCLICALALTTRVKHHGRPANKSQARK